MQNVSHIKKRLPARHVFYCMKCIGDALPFQTVSNEDFNNIFRYTIHELVNIFNSIEEEILDFETEIENNIGDCKYTYTHELGNIHMGHDSVKELSIIHINIRSIFKNMSSLKVLLSKFKKIPDIICLSETNIQLKDDSKAGKMVLGTEKDDRFIPSIEGYDLIRNDCKRTKGGSAIFVKNDLDYTMRDDLLLDITDCEDVWLEIKVKNTKFVVG